jgi:hypothetical protein
MFLWLRLSPTRDGRAVDAAALLPALLDAKVGRSAQRGREEEEE